MCASSCYKSKPACCLASSVCNSPSLSITILSARFLFPTQYSLIFTMRFSAVLAVLFAAAFGYAQELSKSGGDGMFLYQTS